MDYIIDLNSPSELYTRRYCNRRKFKYSLIIQADMAIVNIIKKASIYEALCIYYTLCKLYKENQEKGQNLLS
jgi:hypothetical protein